MLKSFDALKPASIECDASGNGLGAVLFQDEKPVYFASCTLSDAESRDHPVKLKPVVFAAEKWTSIFMANKI